MAKYALDVLADLARQLSFSPVSARTAQLTSAEDLLHEIDPAKAYPHDFVIFKITGYHPKTRVGDTFAGIALQHDLGLLIEEVSASLQLLARAAREPVLCIDDVCENFNVTSKTVQRWRRRGLPGRIFVFDNGKRRVGFLLSSVQRFISRTSEEAKVDVIADPQVQRIVRHGKRLCTTCDEAAMLRRIARKLNHSPLAILHILRKHAPELLSNCQPPLSAKKQSRILRRFKRSLSLTIIAQKSRCPKAAAYNVILRDRLQRLARRRTKFIDDQLYHQDDAASAMEAIGSQFPARNDHQFMGITPAQERAIFLKYNFHRFQLFSLKRELNIKLASMRDVRKMEVIASRVADVRNEILRANLGLIISVAKRHLRRGLNLSDLISDGSLTMMRAIDSFDFHRGVRFSSYATLALMKGYVRSTAPSRRITLEVEEVSDPRDRVLDELLHRDHVDRLLARLEPREQLVVAAHFGIDQPLPSSFEELSDLLGLSPQRLRQIESRAISKLRELVTNSGK